MQIHFRKIPFLVWFFILIGFFRTPELIAQTTNASGPGAIKVEVLYFHAPNRCPSCLATENQTKKVLETHFRSEIAKGLVSFASLDLKESKNKALVEKYEIVFPALLIFKKKGAKEGITDYSTTAFQYAYPEPEKYEKLLRAEILKQLNSK